jgi:outer membrane lipoprotein carrier protein
MPRRFLFASLISLSLFLPPALTALDVPPDLKPLLDRFESRYRSAHTLRATFLERYSENGRQVRVEAGTASFRRPGKMRWEYQSPENNLFLVDGKLAWFYVPADHTVTRVPAKSSEDWRTPLSLLAGEMKLARVCFRIRSVPPEPSAPAGFVRLRCDLRDSAPISPQSPSAPATATAVFFELSEKSADLASLSLHDPGGITIELSFANWQFDPPMPDSSFRFSPPQGVAIVNGELPSGNSLINP